MIICEDKRTKVDLIAVIFIVLAGITMLYIWHKVPMHRTLYVGEPFVDANQFISGANFKQLGFWKLRFTADYAIGPKEYHPFYYTHNAPLSEIINGIYHKIGLTRIELQHLVCIIWTLMGFLFFYAMFKMLVGPVAAFCCLAIALTNPFVIYWGDNLFYSHQHMFFYGGLYYFLRNIRKFSYLSLIFSWLFLFCSSFNNYEFIPMAVFFIVGIRILRLETFSIRRLSVFLSAPLAAFYLRNLLVIWALGYNFWYRDIIEIFLHRSLGIKTSLMEIYKQFPVIMWDIDAYLPPAYLLNLYLRLENLYGYGWSVFLIALIFPFIRRRILPLDSGKRLFHLILLVFVSSAIWYLLFPQQTSAHFHSHTMLLFLPFTCLILSSVLIGLWKNIRYLPIRIFVCWIILSVIFAARLVNFKPLKPFPGINTLKKYEGKIFCTNAIPTLVSYYTKTPTAFCGYEEQLRNIISGKFYFFLRRDLKPFPSAEYFFVVFGWNNDWFMRNFTLVERGKDYAIYRLHKEQDVLIK